ncbi:histidinol-phosphatase HisJ family protein [Pseudoleptotrichia goodfellowii]|uniref:Histidinol-phosphatase n=1 Tax=Pseudoleptotrichia goodfellowii F0264 TaxID=596323 RepID=D0GNK8_9FUSO|nr:histidinol-phosphatase HisJ family protein [Pseudoleptotrichia goodfellowii]EEY34314.1 histidinol phosphate phosphatase HisJ family [Pseudoleptotrichia goodfellowii F0264]MBF4805879.1 histidinol-phosphatase HisJ family protein [Pseudoleptotrichia goodfellowii]
MLADYHIHCRYSDDSEEEPEKIVESAVSKNFDEICFTDHVDYGIKIDHDVYNKMNDSEKEKYKNLLNVDYPEYFREIGELREKSKDKITIRQGLEFGMQTHTIADFQKIFDKYDLDFVILSCHQVNNEEFWNKVFQKGKTPDEYNYKYYEEIYKVIQKYSDYSVLGHLDHIQRYNETIYPFEKSREIITEILKKVIKDGKGIEVNTSSFRYGLKDLTPERNILKLYHELGGKIITIGSDAHKAENVGDHIPYIQSELKKTGFTHICTFDKMKPIFHGL